MGHMTSPPPKKSKMSECDETSTVKALPPGSCSSAALQQAAAAVRESRFVCLGFFFGNENKREEALDEKIKYIKMEREEVAP